MEPNIKPKQNTESSFNSYKKHSQNSNPKFKASGNKHNRFKKEDYKKKNINNKIATNIEEDTKNFPEVSNESIRIITLGGVGEIGKNMYAVEYNKEIILIDCGTTFGESSAPGIDKLMPNIRYLKDRKGQIKRIIITDAALTHSGSLQYVSTTLGNPKIYMRNLTKAIITNKTKEVNKNSTLDIDTIEKNDEIKISSNIKLQFFGISDKTPSTLGVIIQTPSGNIAHTGNLRVESKKNVIPIGEEKRFGALKEKNILLLMSDSVNAERPGFAIYDEEIVNEIAQMISEAPERTIIPLFPSQIKRNALIIERAVKLGKHIYIQGKDLYYNLLSASESGVLNLPKEILMPIQEISEIDNPKKALIILTGEENEEYASLETISQKTHRFLSINKKDTIIFPSPMIPVRASETQDLKDDLSREGAIIRSYNTSDVKASSHAGKAELKWIHKISSPKYFIPVQGYHYMLTAHSHILREIGMSTDSAILTDNGNVVDISNNGKSIEKLKNTLQNTSVIVSGNTASPLQEVVLQDRRLLSEDGIFVIIVFFDHKTLLLKKSPDIISRGFIYLRESQDLINKIRLHIKNVAEETAKDASKIEIDEIKKAIHKGVSNFLLKETNKKPIVVPVLFT